MWGSPSKLDVLIQIPADLPLLFYLESVIEMVEPKQACPRCGADLGRLLYCTPLKDIKLFCPNCGLRVQMKCANCGNWMVEKILLSTDLTNNKLPFCVCNTNVCEVEMVFCLKLQKSS
jgi:ribosomal protein S27AE